MKPRPRKLYAIVNAKHPQITHLELYKETDVKAGKDEEMWEVEVRAIRKIKQRKKH